MSSTITVPQLIAEYAAERGYEGAPRISATFFDGEWHYSSTGTMLTVERVASMRNLGVEKVCLVWDRAGVGGIPADFSLAELSPMAGLRGNPGAAPVEIAL